MPRERAASEMDPVDLIASSNAILPGPTWTFSAKSMRIRITGVIAVLPSHLRNARWRGAIIRDFSLRLEYNLREEDSYRTGTSRSHHVDNLFLERQKHGARCGSEHAVVVGDPRGRWASRYQVRVRNGDVRRLHRPPRRSADPFLCHAALIRGRPENHDDRGIAEQASQSRAGRL